MRHHGLLCGFEFVNGMELEPVWSFLDMRAAVDDPAIGWDHGWRQEIICAKLLQDIAAPLEDHLVLGEDACLVAEHVLHLDKLLGAAEHPALHPL